MDDHNELLTSFVDLKKNTKNIAMGTKYINKVFNLFLDIDLRHLPSKFLG